MNPTDSAAQPRPDGVGRHAPGRSLDCAGLFGACSADVVTVWHRLETPATVSGRHARYSLPDALAAHRRREGVEG